MGKIFVTRELIQRQPDQGAQRSIDVADPRILSLFGVQGNSLPHVSPRAAVGIPALLACLDIKSSDVSMLPRHLYRRTEEGREKAANHDQLYLIKTAPSPYMGAFTFWYTMFMNKYLNGNAYAVARFNRAGRPVGYRMIPPSQMDVFYDKAEDDIFYTDTDTNQTYRSAEVIHLRDVTFDGIKGISRITLARIAFQKGISLETFGAHFYHNGTALKGWIELPDWLDDDEQIAELMGGWEQKYRGPGKSDTALLMGGSKYHSITMSMQDAQFIENQKFSQEQIAMIYRIPPQRLGATAQVNRANSEATSREYAIYTLQSELVPFEEELTMKTLRPSERDQLYWKIEMKGLLRGDTKAQAEWYRTLIDRGLATRNEIRQLEDLNPTEGGDTALLPLNMIPADRYDDYIDAIIAKAVQAGLAATDQSSTQSKNHEDTTHPSVFSANGHTEN